MILVVALGGLATALAPSLYEVLDKGTDVRPYDSGPVYKLRVLDSVTVYASEESSPQTDSISGAVLVALATASLLTLLLFRASGGSRRLRRFYAISAAGFAYLAVDEFMAIHETVGHNLVFLSDIPGVERPDDVIFSLYLIPAAAYVFVFRDVLSQSGRARVLFVAAIAVFLLAISADLAGSPLDEVLEVVVAACLGGGFVSLMAEHLTARLALARWAEPGEAATATKRFSRESTAERSRQGTALS